jgi:hypothetical protein
MRRGRRKPSHNTLRLNTGAPRNCSNTKAVDETIHGGALALSFLFFFYVFAKQRLSGPSRTRTCDLLVRSSLRLRRPLRGRLLMNQRAPPS